jgi:hypothetical protein
MFYYDKQWMLIDGDIDKPSTNGTWLYIENFFEIYNGMIFKAGETLFKADLSFEGLDYLKV